MFQANWLDSRRFGACLQWGDASARVGPGNSLRNRCVLGKQRQRLSLRTVSTRAFAVPAGGSSQPLQQYTSTLSGAWPWVKRSEAPPPLLASGKLLPACVAALQKDPSTGAIPWTPAVQGCLQQYWGEVRGVREAAHLRRHLANARADPRQRDLRFVSEHMAQWDELQRDFPGVDANRLVRGDARVMAQPPSLWASRVQMLTVAHPEIDWVAMMTEMPGSAFIPWPTFVGIINDFAYSLALGFSGIVHGAAPRR